MEKERARLRANPLPENTLLWYFATTVFACTNTATGTFVQLTPTITEGTALLFTGPPASIQATAGATELSSQSMCTFSFTCLHIIHTDGVAVEEQVQVEFRFETPALVSGTPYAPGDTLIVTTTVEPKTQSPTAAKPPEWTIDERIFNKDEGCGESSSLRGTVVRATPEDQVALLRASTTQKPVAILPFADEDQLHFEALVSTDEDCFELTTVHSDGSESEAVEQCEKHHGCSSVPSRPGVLLWPLLLLVVFKRGSMSPERG